ncbi:MAG: DinB family protein [bacterium]|nr:DinB family protein [bacterium]
MRYLFLSLIAFTLSFNTMAQSNSDLPYSQIPEYPEKYSAGTVLSRMVDGLGFRYYWATDSLREEDLNWKPNEEARTTLETIGHIYGLTNVIVNATLKKPNVRPSVDENLSFEELRAKTLNNLKTASEILLKSSEEDIESFMLVFESPRGTSEYPFWNNINGPIADAIWHVGQVVSFRRSSGNPFNSKVSVFNGRLRD